MKSSGLSEKTKYYYQKMLDKISREVGVKRDDADNFKWIASHQSKIIQYIEGLKSNHSKKTNYAIMIRFARENNLSDKVIEAYDDKMMEAAAEVEHQYNSNEMSERQKQNWVSRDDIDKKVASLRADLPPVIDTYAKYKKLIIYLMILIHSHLPLRNDLQMAKVFHHRDKPDAFDKEINYIIIGGKKPVLVLNNYKTEKVYGSKTINLPQEINNELIAYYDEITAFSPSNWFAVSQSDDKPIPMRTFISWFQSVWDGKKVSTTMLRQSAVSELYKVSPEQYQKEQDLANIMAHSMQTARKKYAKVLPVPEDKK